MTFRIYTATAILGLSAACSGGGSVQEKDFIPIDNQFAAFVANTQAIADRQGYVSFGTFSDYTAVDNIPMGGTLTYDGYMALFLDGRPSNPEGDVSQIPNPSHIGSLALAVNLDAQTDPLTGVARGFYDADTTQVYAGQLEFRNSVRNPDQNTPTRAAFDTDIAGTITRPSDGLAFTIDAVAGGVFVGADARGFAGIINGEVRTINGTDNFVGAYLAD